MSIEFIADRYWLAKRDPREVIAHLEAIDTSKDTYMANPMWRTWVRNLKIYHSLIIDPQSWDTSLAFDGELGELVKMQVPQAVSLTHQLISLTTRQRLAFQAIADNSKTDVMKAVRKGTALAGQLVDELNLDTKGNRLAMQAAVMGAGFNHPVYRSDLGIPWEQTDEGGWLFTGKTHLGTPSVLDVSYDHEIQDWDDLDWIRVRTIKNRWTLIAQFPHLAEEIAAIPAISRDSLTWESTASEISRNDLIYVYELFVKQTPYMPNGRMLVYASADCWFVDGENPYGHIPTEPMMPRNVFNMSYGFPFFSMLLPAQEMLDHSFSVIATNQSAFAVQSVMAPKGSGLSVQELNGMTFILYDAVEGGGEPKALQLCATPAEVFKFIDALHGQMVEISNINSALRGSPPAGVTSGIAIATLTANALEFIGEMSQSYLRCQERTMKKILLVENRYPSRDRQIIVSKRNGKVVSEPLEPGDLDAIKDIKIQTQNPLMQTLSGRLQVADNLIDKGLVKSTNEYFRIMDGAPTQELYDVELSEDDLIEYENEDLKEGKIVPVLQTDNHPQHIRRHKKLLNEPETRRNSPLQKNVQDHIDEHVSLGKQRDPWLTAVLETGVMPQMGPGGPQPQLGPSPEAEPSPEMGNMEPQGSPLAQDALGRPTTLDQMGAQ